MCWMNKGMSYSSLFQEFRKEAVALFFLILTCATHHSQSQPFLSFDFYWLMKSLYLCSAFVLFPSKLMLCFDLDCSLVHCPCWRTFVFVNVIKKFCTPSISILSSAISVLLHNKCLFYHYYLYIIIYIINFPELRFRLVCGNDEWSVQCIGPHTISLTQPANQKIVGSERYVEASFRQILWWCQWVIYYYISGL